MRLILSVVTAGLLLTSVGAFASVLRTEVAEEDELDGHHGYFINIYWDGELHETDFVFIEGEYLRLYAYRGAGSENWSVLPVGSYLLKLQMEIGTWWTSYNEGPTIATVVAFRDVETPAGTFPSFVVEHRTVPGDEYVGTYYISEGVGTVALQTATHGHVLSAYHIESGSGYLPLAVGNWAEFVPGDPTLVSSLTWSRIKLLYASR